LTASIGASYRVGMPSEPRHAPALSLTVALALTAGAGCGKREAERPAPATAPEPPGCRIEASGVNGEGGAGGAPTPGLPASFSWTSSGPLIAPARNAAHPNLSVKDPSIVWVEDRFHVFATTANENEAWSMVYASFSSFCEAGSASQYFLDRNPNLRGYHAAPQVFFFRPHGKWYLTFQSGQPQYSTTDDIANPESWSAPTNFFASEPPTVTANKGPGGWLDFWTICDAALCHLFFTDDNGNLYRSQTAIGDFPQGFGDPVVAIRGTKETLFEGSATYAVAGTGTYLTLVEAFGPGGRRYYRSFVAESLDGEWTPLADSWENPFAGQNNVTFAEGVDTWTWDFSHGELIRDGYDETLTISPNELHFLYQGVDPDQTIRVEYFELPYRLALLSMRSEE